MFELYEKKSDSPVEKRLVLSLESEESLNALEIFLKPVIGEEASEQLVFALHAMQDEDFVNHCDEATEALGLKLAANFGDEKSFYELMREANFYHARSVGPLSKMGYLGWHSVGVLEGKDIKNKNFSLALDLTYGDVSGKNKNSDALALYLSGSKEDMLKKLGDHYGGSWETDYELDKKTRRFMFYEK